MALGLFNVISAMQLHGRFRCVPDFLFVFTKFDFEHCSRISKFSIVTTVLPLFIRNFIDFTELYGLCYTALYCLDQSLSRFALLTSCLLCSRQRLGGR